MKYGKAQGFALIDLIFVCGIIGLLCGIALPRLLQARASASSASAVGSMRAINSAELTYALTCGNGFYAPNLTTLGTPPPSSESAFLSPNLTSSDTVIKAGYTVTLAGTAYAGAPVTCNGLAAGDAAQAFEATADPVDPSNFRFFATNASGTIYEHNATFTGAMPETGEPAIGRPYQ